MRKMLEENFICPVCKKQVNVSCTHLELIDTWFKTNMSEKFHLLADAQNGSFLEWACLDCERQQEAVLPDYSKQKYFITGPRPMYIDKQYCCEKCDKLFVFKALEQKYWYEDLGFIIYSEPKKCKECRKEVRSENKRS